MSTLLNFCLIVVFIIFSLAVWNLIIVVKYKNKLDGYSYTRGANKSTPGAVKLKCGNGKEICVYRATQICTNPTVNNFEKDETDPIDSGYNNPNNYGKFNTQTTVNLKNDMSKKCDRKQECIYNFAGKWSGETDGQSLLTECGGNTQLISTYTCIPKGSKCKSSI